MILTKLGQEFMLLGADMNLSGTVWSAADRIRKLILPVYNLPSGKRT